MSSKAPGLIDQLRRAPKGSVRRTAVSLGFTLLGGLVGMIIDVGQYWWRTQSSLTDLYTAFFARRELAVLAAAIVVTSLYLLARERQSPAVRQAENRSWRS